MESKTTLVKVTGKRYMVDCECTASMESDMQAERFQRENWVELGGQRKNYSKEIYQAYESS